MPMKSAPPSKAPPAAEKPKFAKLPSVGTWLAPNPAKLSQAGPAPALPAKPDQAKAPEMPMKSAPPAAEKPKFAKMPSVGTWLAPNPAKLCEVKAQAPAVPAVEVKPSGPAPSNVLPFRPYFETNFKTIQPSAMEKLYAKFPTNKSTASAAQTKDAKAVAPARAAPRKPFAQIPSVGTWLAFKPFEEAPKAVSILERTHSKLLSMNKEELITEFENEIKKRDEEIAKLKSSVQA
mmetsp:Transcript_35268/g.79120  ORF Transcript_35268/g.79120 Transcript_35268/m.79120 type:complete len:234 (-) Transcript_35268:372-1073(-)